MLRLGILDQGRMRDRMSSSDVLYAIIENAKLAERLGYERFWITEHHASGYAHSSPEILIPLIARATNSIRIGAAGILLRYYSPIKVAECFLTLQSLFPGRIELGVCRGPGVTSDEMALALVSGNDSELRAEAFKQKVEELSELLRNRAADLGSDSPPQPSDVPPPPMWILGSSGESLNLAARNDRPFGFMCFAPGAISHGKQIFKDSKLLSSRQGAESRSAIALTAICGETDEAAERYAAYLSEIGKLPMPVNVIGGPKGCVTQIRRTAAEFDVNDVILLPYADTVERQRMTMALIGRASREHGLALV